MHFDSRVIEKTGMREVYITAAPSPDSSPRQQAREIYTRIAEELRGMDARILAERFFGTQDAIDLGLPVRSEVYGDLDDGVPPVALTVPEGMTRQVAGAQVHAIAGEQPPEVLRYEGTPCGRMLDYNDRRYVLLTGLTAAEAGPAPAQADRMFKKADAALKAAGTDMFSVARTWLWLGDILSWYDDLNRVRTAFFKEVGLFNGSPGSGQMPASTGIGVKPANEPQCALDLVAVAGPSDSISYYTGTQKQESAFKYGSAFSRASRAITPAGETVFVSGTASIDDSGATIHVGDIDAQIEETFKCVRAVLDRTGCDENDVVQSIMYCKTPDVEKALREKWGDISWPRLIMISDVCRDDLLFEIEATAATGAVKIS